MLNSLLPERSRKLQSGISIGLVLQGEAADIGKESIAYAMKSPALSLDSADGL